MVFFKAFFKALFKTLLQVVFFGALILGGGAGIILMVGFFLEHPDYFIYGVVFLVLGFLVVCLFLDNLTKMLPDNDDNVERDDSSDDNDDLES